MADQKKPQDEGWYDHASMSFIAGTMMGLSITDRYDLTDDERRYLKKAGEYLYRHAFAIHFEKHGELP